MTEPAILAPTPLFPPRLIDELPVIAAVAEAQAEAAVANLKDAEAAVMFRVSEAADALFVALFRVRELY